MVIVEKKKGGGENTAISIVDRKQWDQYVRDHNSRALRVK